MPYEGGTGDAREDRLIAKRLARIVNVPEENVKMYVKTRNKTQAHVLKGVLQDMMGENPASPSSASQGVLSPGPSRCSSAPSLPSMTSLSLSSQGREQQNRIAELIASRSAYETCHSPGGKRSMQTPPQAFDNADFIKKDFRPTFDRWKRKARAGEVRIVADACRSIRSLGTPPSTNVTSYGVSFTPHKIEPRHKENRDPTKSNVPMGSIGEFSDSEIAAAKARREAQEQLIEKAFKHHQEVLKDKMHGGPLNVHQPIFLPGGARGQQDMGKTYMRHDSCPKMTWQTEASLMRTTKIGTEHRNEQKARPFCTSAAMFQGGKSRSLAREALDKTGGWADLINDNPKQMLINGMLYELPSFGRQTIQGEAPPC
eukprot:gnl/TRDRNA2_/TRDRNA2_201564_c0_seq1.p1 gnl/TRDRNA2_/TRDRNA2_201564_c0~~gnl/TRDRNA2_/TRDRNA2_201564_c0_seq1.p1  ORF type:complete len:371 (-),score=55.59 gnl/TRDRNA2_/TRDRNA2_201564_c0_seq1:166-1278(-)